MNDDWVETTLGNVMLPNKELAKGTGVEAVLSVTEKRGIVPQEEVFRKRIATTDVEKYKVLRHMDIAYNPYLLWTGAVGQWLGGYPGVTSPVYECFRVKPGVSPRFIGLILEGGSLTPYFDSTAIGSIERRRRTTQSVFLRAKISLPPLPVQRRIVDLMAHLDNQIASLRLERNAAEVTLAGAIAHHSQTLSGAELSVRNACSAVIGGIWGQPPGDSEVEVLALGPRVYASGEQHLRVDGSPTRSFTVKQVTSRLVAAGDIILERSGGSPSQPVGRVVIAPVGTDPCVPTDFQRLLRPNPALADPDYLFWRLWFDWKSGCTVHYSRKTTGITNLDVRSYLDRPMVFPQVQDQRFLSETWGAISKHSAMLNEEVSTLLDVRKCVLQSTLDGALTINEDVDSLIDGAA